MWLSKRFAYRRDCKQSSAGALARYDRFIGHRGRRMRCKTINYRLHYLDTLPLEHLIHHLRWSPFPSRGRLKYRDFVPASYETILRFSLYKRRHQGTALRGRSFLSLPLEGKVADAGALARYDRFIGHRGRRMRCRR